MVLLFKNSPPHTGHGKRLYDVEGDWQGQLRQGASGHAQGNATDLRCQGAFQGGYHREGVYGVYSKSRVSE